MQKKVIKTDWTVKRKETNKHPTQSCKVQIVGGILEVEIVIQTK